MTPATPTALPEATAPVAPLEASARALAESQRHIQRTARWVTQSLAPRAFARPLERAQKDLAADLSGRGIAAHPKAAEWFLDNYYLIRRVARQVEEELPRGFVRHLPRLASGADQGKLRIDPLARAIVAATRMTLDPDTLRRFVDAYQTVSPLTIAELWALPTLLRATVLQSLLQVLQDLDVPVHNDTRHEAPPNRVGDSEGEGEGKIHPRTLDPGQGIEQSVRALRVLDSIDWHTFFKHTSRVEAILRTDPAQVYAQMDFPTCDSYRKVIEALAWATGRSEQDVALRAIRLARDGASDGRRGHVGYYLLSSGRADLEAQLGYRPAGIETIRRALTAWPTASYLLPLMLLTWAPLLSLAWYLAGPLGYRHGYIPSILAATVAAIVPASAVVIASLHFAFARLLPPRTLPKLDLKNGLASDMGTLVVIPTLLGRSADAVAMLRQIELHYLSNPDPQLQFALLTDDLDAKAPRTGPDDASLIEHVSQGITALNVKYGNRGRGPFHLLHREPRWNPAEERFMGWERKRGKLEELNRLLRGDTKTSYSRHIGDPAGLSGIRFVITLDSDTQLPMGSAQRLVGLLAHPLNRALFDERTGRVIAGYTIVQPRIETSPSSSRPTLFSRIFAGDIGFDIYAHACSEFYQDLFGSGIYVGKGIYDVDAFMRSVEDRVPENALVSHDLFEGIHGRTALATDIVLYEGYPTSYATYAMRMHRWVRGDWQLLPWLFAKVPSASGGRLWNKLARIDRWKIVDNFRRSLTSPLLLVLLIFGWCWLPGSALLYTIGALALLLAPCGIAFLTNRRSRVEHLGQCALSLAFLAYESEVVVDAIARVLVRTAITRKHLLEWTCSAHMASGIAAQSPRAVHWRQMMSSPLLAVAIAALVVWVRPSALVVAAPLLVIWLIAPEIARWVSQPSPDPIEQLTQSERKRLRRLARRTWRFFDVFVGPSDQWLPIDNYQEDPREQIAHRTSPTNIGLTLLATLSAYDFGYIGPSELSLRLRRTFDSIARLPHYQGHLLNWYDTKNLQPLLPRYVSTVDSGNFAGCLVALKQGCKEVAVSAVCRAEEWEGLHDSIELLEEVVVSVPHAATGSLRSVLAKMQQSTLHARANLDDAYATLRTLCDETSAELDHELLAFLETGAHRHEADLLHALRTSIDRLHQQLRQMRHELDTLMPWLALREEATAHAIDLPTQTGLDAIPAVASRLRLELKTKDAERRQRGEISFDLDASAQRLDEAFQSAEQNATALAAELLALAQRAEQEVHEMDFTLLYNEERRLFRIGHNVTLDQIDSHHYDLLASEARLASYMAIVKREVPEAHWYALGRPLTAVAGAPALLSWGGTMFEYLMPGLLMRSQEGTLLARTSALAVDAQIAHAKRQKAPWGISESAYAQVDTHLTYQYRSFGVPGLGFKRGLEEDQVIASYASILALSIRPRAVVDNLIALEAMGMLGMYGLFESLDRTPGHQPADAPPGKPFTVVRSYMAHHQGMLLIALGNFLNRRSMVDRFHSDALVETGELLLNEQAPVRAPAEWVLTQGTRLAEVADTSALPMAPDPWLSPPGAGPQAFVLSNGRLTSLLTASGGGGLRLAGLAITRYEADATHDEDGVWFYLRDKESGRIWLATSWEGRTTYAMHKVEFHHRSQGISVHVEVVVAAADDVEVRRITLHNESTRRRQLTLTSAGRPVLLNAAQAPVHPAFSSLFIESERLAGLDALLFARRLQTAAEAPAVLVHRLVREGASVTFSGDESDRGAFFGRGASPQAPRSLVQGKAERQGRVGAVLDPIMSLTARVALAPKSSVTLAFVTTLARSRGAAVELAQKYGSMHAVRWAFRDAEHESPRRLQRTRVEPALLPTIQRLYSVLLFADPTQRAPSDVRAVAPPCQRRLWSRGISGDDPIVLVRVSDPSAALLGEVLAAQRYLRSCGVRLDLVLIDEQASGYENEGADALRRVIVQNEAELWINRHGGIFVVVADQVPADEIRHLEACARILLDTRNGSLAARLGRVHESTPKLPRFEATLVDEVAEQPRPRPKRIFENGIGGFSEDGREYVLEVRAGQPTPAPWCNVLANSQLGCLVSESSLGATWSKNSGENRLTPWRNDPVFDIPSEALYLRDEETAAVFSPTPRPAGQRGQILVRHGAGYTTYERESHGLVQELTVFVPPDAALKIVHLRLKNTLARHRRLTATYYAEWVLGSRREGQRPHIVSAFDRDRACLLATCSWNAEFAGRVAFLAAQKDAHGVAADRTEFLGHRGDYARPEALERWGLSGRVDLGADPCAVLQVHIDLAAGETVETHFLLGQSSSRDEALQLVARFRDPAVVQAAWKDLHAYWEDVLGTLRVKTPEPAMDLMLNRWLLYQTLSSRVLGRTGFYQSSGAFGYRDQLQDVLALLHADPAIARGQILDAAAHQFEEGDVLHWWHPPSGRGVRTRCSDDLAWLPYVTGEYVAATGDAAILEELVPFLHGEPLRADEHDRYSHFEASGSSAPLLEHCRRAVERALTEGVHGLPLMGDGDWNDGMSRVGAQGRGESVWLGWFLCATLDRFADLLRRENDPSEAAKWQARAESLRANIKDIAWDGGWYLRAFHDDGSRVGSAKSRECRIDSIVQSWAVLSQDRRGGHDERARAAVDAADQQLVRDGDRLVLVLWPPFDSTLHDPGYIRAYPPGVRENGGQYTHAATWLGFAHAALGDGERAGRIFHLLNPVLRTRTMQDCARYRVEPYALAGDIYSCPPWVGRGGWTWYTGSAAWMWRLGVEAILGLRKEDGFLRIDPCIPPSWEGFEAWVRSGSQCFHIVVENPDRVAGGVATMTVDGALVDSNRLSTTRNVTGTQEVHVRLASVAAADLDRPGIARTDPRRAAAKPTP